MAIYSAEVPVLNGGEQKVAASEVQQFSGDYEFLSNSYPLTFTYNKREYTCIDHFYNAMKDANKHGKTNKYWDIERIRVMQQGLRRKFSHYNVKELLLQTGNSELVHRNHKHDRFWGVCVCAKHQQTGANMLGKLLMKLRGEIARSEERMIRRLQKLYSN